jgi:hypothetical protein
MSRAVRKSCASARAALTLATAITAIPAASHADGRGNGSHQGNIHPGNRWHPGYGGWGAAAAAGAIGGYATGAYGGQANGYIPGNTHSSACAWQYQPNYNAKGDVAGFQRVWTCY